MVNQVRKVLRGIGVEVGPAWPPDFSRPDRQIITRVQPYTMTGRPMLFGLIRAVEYVVRGNIEGAIVECGVWKGGSMMAAALTLLRLGVRRPLYLYDTFEGMTAPTQEDVALTGTSAIDLLGRQPRGDGDNIWAVAALDDVRAALLGTAYEAEHITFVRGPVEETLPATTPDSISILRLDTDWYRSTKHELEHLFPRLSPGGVLIVDDYGYWQGARQATDEYLAEHQIAMLLCRLDVSGRIGVKH